MIILIVLFLFNPYFEFQDGAVYAIIPDCPLIEYPINQTMEFMAVIGMAKYIAGHFNIELFTYVQTFHCNFDVHHVFYILFLPILVLLDDLIPINDTREKNKLIMSAATCIIKQ